MRAITAATAGLALTFSVLLPATAANAVTITAASAVRSVAASDGWSADAPTTGKVILTWKAPTSLYGARLVGYKIEKSINGVNWTVGVANTGSTATNYAIANGLTVGQKTYFRVRAITQKGSTKKFGNASLGITKTPTAIPVAPLLLGLNKFSAASGSTIRTVHWMPQSLGQRGGLTVTYKAEATASGQSPVSCTAVNKTTCDLTGLVAGAKYSLVLSAKNKYAAVNNVEDYVPADADFAKQWYLGSTNGVAATRAWTITRGTPGFVIAVLDSGITTQPELEGQVLPGYDFVTDPTKAGDGDGRDADPTDMGDGDGNWHGTHVAGIIAAKADSVGITGIAPNSKILPVRVLGPGGGTSGDLMDGMLWAAGISVAGVPDNANPAKILNLSLVSANTCSAQMQRTIDTVMAKGVIVVTAAGNGDETRNNAPMNNALMSPTGCSGPFSVGASTYDGDHAFYSNYNVDIMAPGGDFTQRGNDASGAGGEIYSLWNPGYKAVSGTSMAAPIVSGILALLLAVKPTATDKELANALLESATPFAANSQCVALSAANNLPTYCGYGIANAAAAIEALLYPSATPIIK